MIKLKPFQVFDVLSQEDFERVLIEKNNYLSKKQPGLEPGTRGGLNFKFPEKEIGVFALLCDKISDILISKGFKDPDVEELFFLNQKLRKFMPFHMHRMSKHRYYKGSSLFNENKHIDYDSKNKYDIPYEYFWIAIYYPHDIYEKDYHGKLTVRKNESSEGFEFQAVPNSLVMHNGLYGHEMERLKIDPNKIRVSCFSHWFCHYP